MESSPIYGLGYLRVRSDKVDEWCRLAERVVGMMVDEHAAGVYLRMDERVARIVVEVPAVDSVDRADVVLGWECRNEHAWRSARELVEKAGLPTTSLSSTPWAREVFRFDDPSGQACDCFYGGKIEPVRQFISPTGVSFVTGDQAMGHVTLFARDYDASVDFYEKALGFQLRETIDTQIRAAFLSPNGREHSLALIASEATAVHHLMIEVTELDSVGRAMDRCFDGEAPVTLSIGRHWNDYMISFYLRSPAGFEIEYGFGGRKVSGQDWTRVEQGGVGGSSYWGHRVVRTDGSIGRQIGQESI